MGRVRCGGSDRGYLDQLVVKGTLFVPTANFADLLEPALTGDWDSADSTGVIAELREDLHLP